jgi:hypothetical protein
MEIGCWSWSPVARQFPAYKAFFLESCRRQFGMCPVIRFEDKSTNSRSALQDWFSKSIPVNLLSAMFK